jgi:hypothetical protein
MAEYEDGEGDGSVNHGLLILWDGTFYQDSNFLDHSYVQSSEFNYEIDVFSIFLFVGLKLTYILNFSFQGCLEVGNLYIPTQWKHQHI